MIVKDVAKEDFFVIAAARNMQHSRKKLLMPIRIGKSMKIHDTLYMPRKCMDGGDEDVFLFICTLGFGYDLANWLTSPQIKAMQYILDKMR